MDRILTRQSSYRKLQLEQLVGNTFQGKGWRTQMAPGTFSGCGHVWHSLVYSCHGSWVPGPILTVSCLCACAYVWAGVCGCVWLRLIRSSWESSPLGYICSCHALSFVRSLQCCGRRLRSVLVPRFLSPAASWTPITGPLAAHCFPALPASALRKAPFLPTESSASALRKAPFLPTESSASVYEELHF